MYSTMLHALYMHVANPSNSNKRCKCFCGLVLIHVWCLIYTVYMYYFHFSYLVQYNNGGYQQGHATQ